VSNIAHIAYSGIGGLAEVCLSLLTAARRLENSSDQHCVGFYGVEPLAERYIDRCRSLDLDFRYIEKKAGYDSSSSRVMSKWLREHRPDVVITHMTQTFLPFLRYKLSNPEARVIVVEHHSNALKGAKDWLLTIINHWMSDTTVYLSGEYRDQVKKKLRFFLRDRKVRIIPNGLDIELYSPPKVRELKTENLVFGMQGRMVGSKDYFTLIRAFAKFRESAAAGETARLEIAGDGPMLEELTALAAELGVAEAVEFLGMIPQDEMISRMQSWDIFVLSTFGETMSRALMEAQSCGLPLVASDVSGVSAAIDHGETGLLVPGQDPSALAVALAELAESPDLRRRLAENGRRHAVENFSADQSWSRYREVVSNVLA
jgi:glycosyltransferase involved in cell wall biosynthesis